MIAFPKAFLIGGWGSSLNCWGGAKQFALYTYEARNTIYVSDGECPKGTSIYALSSAKSICNTFGGDGGVEGAGSETTRCTYYPPESFVCIKD